MYSIQNPPGWVPRLVIEDLHLTSNAKDRCYHWLEIQYNLPGQTGIRFVCKAISRESCSNVFPIPFLLIEIRYIQTYVQPYFKLLFFAISCSEHLLNMTKVKHVLTDT